MSVRSSARTERIDAGSVIEIEEHELAAVGRQAIVERVNDGRGADRRVDGGLKREHRREGGESAVFRQTAQVGVERPCERRGLERSIGGERVVLDRVVFRQHVEPPGLFEVGDHAQPADPPGQPGRGRHPIIGDSSNTREGRGCLRAHKRLGGILDR